MAQDLATWQDMSPSDGTEDAFFRFCDALEVQDGEIAPASGWGLDYALPSWGNYWMRTTATAGTLETSYVDAGSLRPSDLTLSSVWQ